jgi:mRNA-degrading endonuclease toxin of MazEF toxin-antitoxin module
VITPNIVKTGELYWCEPDPADTVGSEIEKDRIWLIVSQTHLHRKNNVVAVPLSRTVSLACAHLIAIPKSELIGDGISTFADSVALTDQIRCLDKRRFRKKAGNISTRGLNSVRSGLERLFGLC